MAPTKDLQAASSDTSKLEQSIKKALGSSSPMRFSSSAPTPRLNNTPLKGSNGTDSGYASVAQSPARDPVCDELSQRVSPQLWQFNQEPSHLEQLRFRDLVELWKEPLMTHLYGNTLRRRYLSIRLKFVGQQEQTAKPCVVVLCPKSLLKRAKLFFQDRQVKDDLRPKEPTILPSFNLLICDTPPKLAAAVVPVLVFAHSSHRTMNTLCGALVKTAAWHATMGGTVMLSTPAYPEGRLYGMTAGHLWQTSEESDDDQEGMDDESEIGSDNGFYMEGDAEYDLDYFPTNEPNPVPLPHDQRHSLGAHQPSNFPSDFEPYLGRTLATLEETGPDLDYALVDLQDASHFRPNLSYGGQTLRRPAGNEGLLRNALSSGLPVMLINASTPKLQRGTLWSSRSYLSVGLSDDIVETYALTLSDGSCIERGYSGTWVVDLMTYEVYGHIVASDKYGDAYVVPLLATFRDMEKRYGASKVKLPTNADVASFRDMANRHPVSRVELLTSADVLLFTPGELESFTLTELEEEGDADSTSYVSSLRASRVWLDFSNSQGSSNSPPSRVTERKFRDSGYNTASNSPQTRKEPESVSRNQGQCNRVERNIH